MNITLVETCRDCGGSGADYAGAGGNIRSVPCHACGGNGFIEIGEERIKPLAYSKSQRTIIPMSPRQSPDVHWMVMWFEGKVRHELQVATAAKAESQLQETGGTLFRWDNGGWINCGRTQRRSAQ